MFDFLKGKRTYIIAVVTAALAVAPVFGYTVPEGVIAFLTSLGLVTARVGAVKA